VSVAKCACEGNELRSTDESGDWSIVFLPITPNNISNDFTVPAANQAIASSPWMDTSVSSFAAGPLGIFSPRSHLLTTPTVTFK